MIKADNKVKFSSEDYETGKEEIDEATYTNFEELKVTVEVLKEQVEELVNILIENDLTMKKEIQAKYFDYDDVYNRLGEMEFEKKL